MSKRVTIKDIAQDAGVSLFTAHCALAGKTGIGEATRNRILKIAEVKGYRRNAVAASLKRKTIYIGATFPEPVEENRFYFSGVWNGVRDCLRSASEFNFRLVELPYKKASQPRDDEIETLFAEGKLDGLLAVGFMDDFGQASLNKCAQLGIPTVLVGEDAPFSGRLCCVQPNYDVVGRTIAELICRQMAEEDGSILLCAGNAAMPSHYLVVSGFDAYLRENGRENAVYKIHTETLGANGVARVARELARHDDIVACASVNARGSVVLGAALIESGRAGSMPAVGSELFTESGVFLKDGVFTNIIHKNPYKQAFRAARILVEHLWRNNAPKDNVVFVKSEMVFQSSLAMHVDDMAEMASIFV